MNKKELIESISHLPSDYSGPRPMIDKLTTLELIKLLDETQEVEIPMFVADFITEQKKLGHTLSYSIDAWIDDFVFALQVGKLVVDTAKAIIVDDNLLGSNGKFVLDSHTFNITVSEEK